MKALMTITILLLTTPLVSAFVIQGVETNQDSYANGDLIIITIATNQRGLELNADFTRVDTNHNALRTLLSEEDFLYKAYYPISHDNTKSDGTYNAVLTLYDPATDSSQASTVGINLDNDDRTRSSEDTVRINVRGEPLTSQPIESEIGVEDGEIKICTPTGCDTLTEKEYYESRELMIDADNVTLSTASYDELVQRLEASVGEEVKAELDEYINRIIAINRAVEDELFTLRGLVEEREADWANQSRATNEHLQRSNLITIGNTVGLIAFILIIGYLFYLERNTTWLS